MNNKLPTNYVLIDFENVQPKNLELLSKNPFKVLVFVGANQTKVPYDLAEAMQRMGENAKYIQITGNGKNALDFHIAFYIGELATKDSSAHFHIISKDTGFDPLIRHLKSKKIHIQREKDLAEIPILRMDSAAPPDDKISIIVKNLIGRAQSRPRKEKTLANSINSWFTKKLDEKELNALIQSLKNKGYITVKDGNVSYRLPKKA